LTLISAPLFPPVDAGTVRASGDGCLSKYFASEPEQHIGKAGYHGSTENSHIERCTQTAESDDVEVQDIFNLLAPELFFFNFSTPCI